MCEFLHVFISIQVPLAVRKGLLIPISGNIGAGNRTLVFD